METEVKMPTTAEIKEYLRLKKLQEEDRSDELLAEIFADLIPDDDTPQAGTPENAQGELGHE